MELTRDKIELISRIIKGDRKYLNNEDLFEDFLNETCKRSTAIFETLENEATLETYLRKVVTTSIINVLKDSGRLRRARKGYVPLKEVPLSSVEVITEKQQNATPLDTTQYVFPTQNTSTTGTDTAANSNIGVTSESQETYDIKFTSDTTVDDVLDSFFGKDQDFSVEAYNSDVALEQTTVENTNKYSTIQISYLNVKMPNTPEDYAIQKETLEFVADTIKHIDSEYPSEKYMEIYLMRYEKGMTQKEIAKELEISQSEVSKRLFGLINKVKNIIEN